MTDSTDNALKPCPFCGENPYTRETQDEDLSTHDTVTWKFVGCWNCEISFGIPDGYDCGTAAEQWNRRTDLPATDEQVRAHPKVRALVEAVQTALNRGVIWRDETEREFQTPMRCYEALHDALAAFDTGDKTDG